MPAAFANSREVVPSKPFVAKTFLTASMIACLRSLKGSREESFMCKPVCILRDKRNRHAGKEVVANCAESKRSRRNLET